MTLISIFVFITFVTLLSPLLDAIIVLIYFLFLKIKNMFRTKWKVIPYNDYYTIMMKPWYKPYYSPYHFSKAKEYVTIVEAEQDIKQIKKIKNKDKYELF